MIAPNKRIDILRNNWKDERSKRVVFLSHCLLNENTRYMGGAFCGGVNHEVMELFKQKDIGIVQINCPERISWGGIYKKNVFQFFGVAYQSKFIFKLLKPFVNITFRILNRKMKGVARYTANEIQDYIKNGMEVIAFVGVGGSPSCGVCTTPDIKMYFSHSARMDIFNTSRSEHNEILRKCTISGQGAFVKYLKRYLNRKKINIPLLEYDVFDEMDGKTNSLLQQLRPLLEKSKKRNMNLKDNEKLL